jgi:hypothetical protein
MAGNKQWVLSLNLAGKQDFVPGEQIARVPTGPYMVLIEDSEQVPKRGGDGCDNIVFHLKVEEAGPEKGKKLRIYLPIDPNVADGLVGQKWATVARCCAKSPAALESGAVKHGPTLYNGKIVPIYVQDNPGKDVDPKTGKERDKLQNLTFISRETYAKFKAEMGASTANGAASGASMTVTGGPAAANSGAAPTAPADVALE